MPQIVATMNRAAERARSPVEVLGLSHAMTPGVLAERAPHREVRRTVDSDGLVVVRELYQAFDAFNRAYFGGALREPLLLVTETSAPRALGDHCDKDQHGLRSVIRLAPRVLDRGMLFAKDILLHEMIHTWQGEIVEDLEEGYRGHGPLFSDKCNTIGGKLELPPVSPKGRNGRADCAGWPVNVRPPGYYGTDAGEADRVKRVTKRVRAPKPPPDPDDVGGDEDLVAAAPLYRRRRLEVAASVLLELSSVLRARKQHNVAMSIEGTRELVLEELELAKGAA
jgi:hypothetical protein